MPRIWPRSVLANAELETIKSEGKVQAEIAKIAAKQAEAVRKFDEARAALARDSGSAEYAAVGPVFPARSSGKRAALARWITGRDNPLAARVAVNHLWRWHFGTGLVETTYDFGRNGKRPTHSELLDWLAMELMEPTQHSAAPWSMKALHRLMVTSATYRMGSRPSDAATPPDDQKRWYGHFASTRMEAEEIRDSVLHAAGTLDPVMFGPDIDHSLGLTSRRRSLYFTHHGESRMQFLELFDAADACDGYRRTESIVPQQALAIVNNAMLVELSAQLEDRLWSNLVDRHVSGSREDAQTQFVDAVFEQVLSRRASVAERKVCRQFLQKQADILASIGEPRTSSSSDARARAGLIHALFSHNDFVTIH